MFIRATGAHGSRQGIDRADPDGVAARASPRSARRGDERERTHAPDELSHLITARRLATAWVVAGTVHEPDAHRCQPNSRPPPRSTGNAARPYAGTCTSANSSAPPPI